MKKLPAKFKGAYIGKSECAKGPRAVYSKEAILGLLLAKHPDKSDAEIEELYTGEILAQCLVNDTGPVIVSEA